MNTLITSVLVSTMCLFGTKLKIVESNFQEIAPGVATGFVITKYEVQLKSSGNKEIKIDEVWLRNRKASWALIDSEKGEISSITEKKTYLLKGEIMTRPEGVPTKGESNAEAEGNFEEEFVIRYRVGEDQVVKCLNIEDIDQVRLVKTK